MCRSCAEGGRRCPRSVVAIGQANWLRRAGRAQRSRICDAARLAGWNEDTVSALSRRPPSAVRQWAEENGLQEFRPHQNLEDWVRSEWAQMVNWSDDDLDEMLTVARQANDTTVEYMFSARIRLREQRARKKWEATRSVTQAKGEMSRRQMREEYDAWVLSQYVRAEQECSFLLNKTGQVRGVDARSLFAGPARRAAAYASEELKRWWVENGRMPFDAWCGDEASRWRAMKMEEFAL